MIAIIFMRFVFLMVIIGVGFLLFIIVTALNDDRRANYITRREQYRSRFDSDTTQPQSNSNNNTYSDELKPRLNASPSLKNSKESTNLEDDFDDFFKEYDDFFEQDDDPFNT